VQVLQPWEDASSGQPREFEQPVPFVRVALDGSENVLFEVDGWPAAFTKTVGKGKVLFTTLGADAWHRPRLPREPRAPYDTFQNLPVPLRPLERLAVELHPDRDQGGVQAADLTPLLNAEIGYTVLGLPTVAVVLIGFAALLLAAGWLIRHSRRSGAAGWLVPAFAVAAAGLLAALGTAKRQAVPPTAGTASVVEVAPGSGEAAVDGVFAVYRPDPGPTHLAAEHGGNIDLDVAGLEGQSRRRVQTDLDDWHWEGLALPAGVRTGPFRATMDVAGLAASARFGPGGLEGRLTTGPFRELSDHILLTPARRAFGVRVADDGAIASGPNDALPPGQYMSSTVLSDRQQRRQEVYRQFFSRPVPRHLEGRSILLAWSETANPPFVTEPGDRAVGATLLMVPVQFERPPADSPVLIPSGFVPYSAVIHGRPVRPTLEASSPVHNRLRFELPRSALPLQVERATLTVRVRAPSRRVSVQGYDAEKTIALKEADSPIDPIRVDVTDPRFLQPDSEGCLYLGVEIGGRLGANAAEEDARNAELDELWRIESIGLEVVGRTQANNGK
jgi:hypothetical protein